MRMQGFKPSDLYKLLKKHGWAFSHRKSSHVTYKKVGCTRDITIVDNNNKEMCRPLVKRLLKEAGISC